MQTDPARSDIGLDPRPESARAVMRSSLIRFAPLLALAVGLSPVPALPAGVAAPPPLNKPRAGPRNLDLLGVWVLAPGTSAEPLRISFEHQNALDPKCLLVIDTHSTFVREACTLKRDGDVLTISGVAVRSAKVRRAADDLRLVLNGHDRMTGRWSAAPGTEIQLYLKGSNAETALTAPPQPDPAQLAAELKKRQDEALRRLTDLVRIPAGAYDMGSTLMQALFNPSERPRHPVQVEPFDLGRTPVTFEQWDACAQDGACYRPDDLGWGRANQPVINVSAHDIQVYLDWLSKKTGREFRLPSEAEWEYAARAHTTTARYWGNAVGHGNADCIGCGSAYDGKQSSPVGTFAPNAFGLADMLGDVWQLLADCWHDSYVGAPLAATAWLAGTDCEKRVVRGGSWNREADFARAGKRVWLPADARYNDVGFRVASTPSP